jgi:hypothetical protein
VGSGHSYDDFGAIVAGISSISNAPYANFLGDDRNMASSFYATSLVGLGTPPAIPLHMFQVAVTTLHQGKSHPSVAETTVRS